ncbi:immunoglobulin-like domain-containing protein [Paenibacillus solisilvae]|uniref:Immunoglobulin-like domain-containing protein n=1 Tax=Paenibacillus solisilvae TaxID=2486751 RepID=A0ABW0W0Q1_9BACL
MKRWTALLVILSLFVFSTTTMAHGYEGSKKNSISCKKIEDQMLHALNKIKNGNDRAELKKKIDEFRKKCEADQYNNNGKQSDLKRVTADKNELQIRYTNNDSANRVTGPVILSQRGTNGSVITWSSSNPGVISNNGLNVNRSNSSDQKVILTAKIRYSKTSVSKSFTLIVKSTEPVLTDAQKLAKDKEALTLSFNGVDNAGSVTQKLKTLPTKGKYGSSIYWYSSSPNLVSADGQTINRPAAGTGDINLTLTALIYNNSAADVKIFTITVKQQISDVQLVAEDKAALQIDFGGNDDASHVTRAIDKLPSKGQGGSTIIWNSSSPSILSNDGKTIHRPAYGSGDAFVVMTAFISSNGTGDVKVFILTVKQSLTNGDAVAADKAELAITFKDSDNASNVTKAISLPTKGSYGSTIKWYSSMTSVISDNGSVVNRPARGKGDAIVTLIAIISSGNAADVKTFYLTVKQMN